VGTFTLIASSKNLLSGLSAGALLLRPFTVLRTHMDFLFSSDQLGSGEAPRGQYGQIVVTDSASAIGVTAVPSPSANPEADWFVHQAMSVRFDFVSGVGFDGNAGRGYSVDSKAMRKVGPDDDIVAMFTMDSAFGGILTNNGRRLIQLH